MLDRLEPRSCASAGSSTTRATSSRTLLANLKVELELALRRSRTPDELQAALRSAAVETDRLTSLAEDLLVLARAADGRLPIRREEIDLGPLVGDVTRRFAGRAEARGITMATSVDRDGTARVDEARVRQALGNLIENALVQRRRVVGSRSGSRTPTGRSRSPSRTPGRDFRLASSSTPSSPSAAPTPPGRPTAAGRASVSRSSASSPKVMAGPPRPATIPAAARRSL